MAKDNQKKNARANHRRLSIFLAVSLLVTALQLFMRWWWPSSQPAKRVPSFMQEEAAAAAAASSEPTGGVFAAMWEYSGVAFWLSQDILYLLLLRLRGAATMDPKEGVMVSSVDLSDPEQLGYYSYAQDALWVCWAAQGLASVISPWLGVVWFVIPVFLIAKVYTGVIAPQRAASRAAHDQQALDAMAQRNGSGSGPAADLRTRLHNRRAEARGGHQQGTGR